MRMNATVIGALLAGVVLGGAPRAAEAQILLDTIQGDSYASASSGGYYTVSNIDMMGEFGEIVSTAIPFSSATNATITDVTAYFAGQGQVTLGVSSSPFGSFIGSSTVTLDDGPTTLGNLNWSISAGSYWLTAVASPGTNAGWILNSGLQGNLAQSQTMSFMGMTNSNVILAGGAAPEARILASAAVPEASTWAMLLLGFSGLGFAGFRNRRAAISVA